MGDQIAASTINIPQLPFKQESVRDQSLLHNTFDFEEVAGTKFVELLSRNLISALSCTGNIQHPDSLLCIDIPYFWCNYCSYTTIQKSEMLDHLHCHRFHCQFCDFSAFTRCEVLKHSRNSHHHETDFRLFWFCVLNCDQNLVEESTETPPSAKHTNCKRSRKPETKQSEVLILKKIKLEKPDGELLETSVEVPNTKLNNPPVDSTSLSDSLVIQRMDHFRKTLSQLSDKMDSFPGHADPFDAEVPKTASKHQPHNTISENNQNSYLRTILTTEENSIPTNEPRGKNGLRVKSKISAHTHSMPVEPVVKMEVIDDSYVDDQASYPVVNEVRSLTALLRKDSLNPPKSSSPDPTNLPLLRTMLQCTEVLTPSTASSMSGDKNDSLSDESENDTDNDDDEKDADYTPTKNYSSGEEWSYSKKGKGKKKRKKVAAYSCPNCNAIQLTFLPTKNHLFRAHRNANLVLREETSNTYVFICPSLRCTFRHSIFTTFVRHLEKCDVFSEKKYDNEEGFDVMSTLLTTFRNVLERSKIPWTYACCLCSTKFTDLSDALSHAHKSHLTCSLSDCLFKLRNKTAVMYCKHCKAEVSVSNWSVLLNKNCKHHKLSHANLTLDQSPQASSSLPSTSTSPPPSKADSTPQLRAMLQRKTEYSTDADVDRSREVSPDGENLPASRMLQWLITEGGRMMHMLK